MHPETFNKDLSCDPSHDEELLAVLRHVPFDGWHTKALEHASVDLGLTGAHDLFEGRPLKALEAFFHKAQKDLVALMATDLDIQTLPVHKRIERAVITHILSQKAHKACVQKAFQLLVKPAYLPFVMRMLSSCMDDIWYLCGDRSTDWNYYSKRIILGGVYLSTLRVWLGDETDEALKTKAHLKKALGKVAQIPKIKKTLSKPFDTCAFFLKTRKGVDPTPQKKEPQSDAAPSKDTVQWDLAPQDTNMSPKA